MNPQIEERLAHEGKKGCGMIVISILLAIVFLFSVPTVWLGRTMIPEFVAVAIIVVSLQLFARRIAQTRLELAREPFQKKRYAEVVATLEPFLGKSLLWPNARFDKEGEALYMLAAALKAEGRESEARQVVQYLRTYRRGAYLEKANKLLPKSDS